MFQKLQPGGAPGQRTGLPSPEELAVIVQTQTDYMYQLEAENRYCKVNWDKSGKHLTTICSILSHIEL